ncbi:hypothetical protein HYH02_001910 [Chlamydomonas schloesseri]|uniref:Uncharacterized protein n=1 Tax=Chlamydomonas schloesseri TaxID=2026947 RepID=A0A836BBX7_9CHLO|nr:hypothetical protein HYH02_001910 [Chlamydomonas schloesseri]|eukprot:KAG2453698.1 hypothetical protein HYH02_001910 [Chlamydomonas schloesseri]
MLLRLRQALPLLQTFTRWSAIAPVPRFRSFAASPAAADGDGALPLADAADSAAAKPKRTRRATAVAEDPSGDVKAAAKKRASRKAAAAAADPEPASDGDGGEPAAAAPKKRAPRRKAQAAEADGVLSTSTSGSQDDGTTAAATAAKPKATRTRRAKAAAEPAAEAGLEAAAAAVTDTDTQPAAPKKRTSRRKTTTEPPEDGGEERLSILSLPYEECLVLPRQAEALLVTLGLRPPPYSHEPAASASSPAAAPSSSAAAQRSVPGTPLRNVLELAEFEGRPGLSRYAEPLLLAQYQGLLGEGPDYLYDMFLLDAGPPHLDSDVVREAVVAAARATGVSSSGRVQKAVYERAWTNLEEKLTTQVLLEQERRLTDAQVELFVLDWSSANTVGTGHANTRAYLAQRCAALTLKSAATIERLHLYANKGLSLLELKERAGVSIKTPMSALLDGLKAGVALPRQRLLDDFRLGEGTGLGSRLPELLRLVRSHAADSAEPGSSSYYNTLRGKLTTMPEVSTVVREQERRWQQENQGSGEDLTTNQLRLLFHLDRLDRFRAEYQARLAAGQQLQQQQQQQQAFTGAGQHSDVPPGGFSA